MTTRPPLSPSASRPAAGPLRSKVPEITLAFWIIKLLTTGMGEAASDFLAHRLGPLPAVALSGLGLVLALTAQLRARHYRAWIYWSAVVMVSVFGTLAADAAHVGFGLPYGVSSLGFSLALAVIFTVWHRREGTLSVHSIVTRRREVFYWLTVLTTFALGTAAGDMTAKTLNLGWWVSGLLFAALMVAPALLPGRRRLPPVLGFWWAYILTRPVGASFADGLAVPPGQGGLGLGTGHVALALSVLIVVSVGFLARTRRDVKE